jgi:nucleoid-associated protein YgaU
MSDVPAEATHKVGGALTKKIGPLPGFAWLLIVVGAAYGWYYWKGGHSVGASAPAPASLSTDTGAGTYTGATTDTTGSTFNGSVSTTPAGAAPATTNAQWARNVADGLITSGANPTDVENALSAYLNGQTLTPTQNAIINTALRQYGQPPEGIIAVHSPAPVAAPKPVAAPGKPAPKPVPKPAPKPVPHPAPRPAAHTYVVRPGDSLSLIAGRYYGNVSEWPKIYNANRSKIHNPNLIYPGQVLSIPA